MIAYLKMRFCLIRGGGVDGDGAEHPVGGDEIRIANAHMHFRAAKRSLKKEGGTPTKGIGICWRNTWLSSAPTFFAATSAWRCSV